MLLQKIIKTDELQRTVRIVRRKRNYLTERLYILGLKN